jgi:pimeloyl-ACP methyl ester carboxylesterase
VIALKGIRMIEDARGVVDYEEQGAGPAIVLVPGSCATGAAWRPVISALNGRFRCITTSLPGYGGTAERRPVGDPSIAHLAEALETVVRRAGGPVHLVGHSFGGLVALAVALREKVPLASLAIIEAPAIRQLLDSGELDHYRAFRAMTDVYFAAFQRGEAEAIATMIDFYGGAGTFASWPERVRAYAIKTTAVNIRDWASAFEFSTPPAALAGIRAPVLVVRGDASAQAVQRANALLSERIGASLATIDAAAHFLIATHAEAVGQVLAGHVFGAERRVANVRRHAVVD